MNVLIMPEQKAEHDRPDVSDQRVKRKKSALEKPFFSGNIPPLRQPCLRPRPGAYAMPGNYREKLSEFTYR